jgi:hypothetical protein
MYRYFVGGKVRVKQSLQSRSRHVLGTRGHADKKRGKQARWLQGYGKGETFNGDAARVTASCRTTVHA